MNDTVSGYDSIPPSGPSGGWLTRRRAQSLLSFAHRGGAACWPENTLLAFEEALKAGCGCLETDLHISQDGELVLLHDPTLDRTTNGSGEANQYNWEELKKLDAGYHFGGPEFPHRGQGLKVPRLADLSDLPGDFLINVEIKSDDERIPDALCTLIQQQRWAERIVIAGENHRILQRFRQTAARRFGIFGRRGVIATSASRFEAVQTLTAIRSGTGRFLRPRYDALQVPVQSGRLKVVTPKLVDWAHSVGVQVHVWTINEEEEMRRLLALGVDGLVSDYPERLVSVMTQPE